MSVKLNPVKGRIVTRFDERKTAAAAAVLLEKAGGKLPYISLLKVLYLADRESWRRYNRPITGDKYVSMDHGPVLSKTYNLICQEDVKEGPWSAAIQNSLPHDVELRGAKVDAGPLSEAELEILEDVFRFADQFDKWGLVRFTHTLQEWEDPEGSSTPITPEKILTVLGKSAEEIDESRQEWSEREYLDQIFGA